MGRENYFSSEIFCEEEWEKEHERYFIFWFQAHSQSVYLWQMNELCVQMYNDTHHGDNKDKGTLMCRKITLQVMDSYIHRVCC
jgi:hypothetical protein